MANVAAVDEGVEVLRGLGDIPYPHLDLDDRQTVLLGKRRAEDGGEMWLGKINGGKSRSRGVWESIYVTDRVKNTRELEVKSDAFKQMNFKVSLE